jgi:hypothetical protein
LQRHFSRYLRQRLHQKVRRTHPHLQHGARMLDGFAAHTHGWRVLIEPRLRGLDDVFVFPALDTPRSGYLATAANVEHAVERRVLPVGRTVRIR